MSENGHGGSRLRVAIIGAGPGGLCTGKRLLDEGLDDFVILERTDEVGGTWNVNRYPGCECDIPSALYSFSFEPKVDWSKPYGTQPEILGYLRHVAEKYGLLSHCRFGDGVVRATWDEGSATWTLTLASGEQLEAEVVVSAVGMFNDVYVPDIEGLGDFAGTMFHSARWPRDHGLTGERVAVIGSAASAVQLVPEVRKIASQVHLFQRTANWVLPKVDTPFTQEQLDAFREDPSLVLAFRGFVETNVNKGMTFSDPAQTAESEAAVLAAMEVVEDPEVRRKLVPDHPFGCKRPLMSNDYYKAFNEPNLELVTEPIERVTAEAVVTVDGIERPVDTIVLATGFATTKYFSAIDAVGRDGRHIAEAWNDGAEAYLGITTPGFPNLFMLYGPNTNNGSIITMIEYQVEHVLAHVRRLVSDDGVAWIEVRPDAVRRFNAEVQEGIAGVKPWNAGCNGYYRAPSGRVVTQWPWSMEEFARRSAEIDGDAFEMGARR